MSWINLLAVGLNFLNILAGVKTRDLGSLSEYQKMLAPSISALTGCVLEKCACAHGRASWSPLQTMHQSVTNKPALESVLEIAASFPGFRFHLSALRQGFRTFTTWNLHSNMLQKGVVCIWGRLLHMQGLERRLKSNYFCVRSFWMC